MLPCTEREIWDEHGYRHEKSKLARLILAAGSVIAMLVSSLSTNSGPPTEKPQSCCSPQVCHCHDASTTDVLWKSLFPLPILLHHGKRASPR